MSVFHQADFICLDEDIYLVFVFEKAHIVKLIYIAVVYTQVVLSQWQCTDAYELRHVTSIISK